MINLENLQFLKEEVIVTKPKQEQGITGNNPFADAPKVEDKTSYIMVEVVKVGEKQETVNVGEKFFISEQFLSTIPIKNQGILDNIYKLNNSDPLFARYAESKE